MMCTPHLGTSRSGWALGASSYSGSVPESHELRGRRQEGVKVFTDADEAVNWLPGPS
jgi:hypothetical protein